MCHPHAPYLPRSTLPTKLPPYKHRSKSVEIAIQVLIKNVIIAPFKNQFNIAICPYSTISVPTFPLTADMIFSMEVITARRLFLCTNWTAASTFGRMEPAAN
jgi:hypothetical protein